MAATKKKSSSKKASTKKASTKKASKKSGGSKNQTPNKKFCTGWKAWQNSMPPGPSTINVVGQCTFPTHGYKVKLTKAVPQGINPAILMLRLTITKPTGPVILTPEWKEVRYSAKAPRRYTNVTILPDGGTYKVQQVM
jgi:hypothetical protein